MHNLSTVFWFEVVRTLKKKSFWLISLSFPIIIAIVVGIVVFANRATSDALEEASTAKFTIAITDESDLIKPSVLEIFKAEKATNKNVAIEEVKAGKLDAYFYYPEDVTKQEVEIYAKDVGLFDNSRYESVANLMLNQSTDAVVTPAQASVLQGDVKFSSTSYKEGSEFDGFSEMIAPGLFLVLFYFLIAFFGNQMLTSTIEEKENRVIEMILTTVQARTLIVGKILSLIVLGLMQTAIIMTPIIIGYLLLNDRLSLPSVDLSNIPLDWARISIGAALFLSSFLLFTGLLVTIGASMPTAKEAGSFFGIVITIIFAPLYAAPLFISSPNSPIVQVLSYFPFTAPIPLMLRNAVGNLEVWQAVVAIVVLLVTSVVILRIAIRVFRYGALEYSRKLSIREVLRPRR